MNPEIDALREENSRLRELCRTHEIDRDTKEFYERLLTEIGNTVGCSHLDERLPSCVYEVASNAALLKRHLRKLAEVSRDTTADNAFGKLIDLGVQAKEFLQADN